MAKQRFFPKDFEAQVLWLTNFTNTLPTYAAKYGILPTQITALDDDKEWLGYWLAVLNATKPYAQSVTAFKNEVAYGVPTGGTPAVPPVLTLPGTIPTAVAAGVFPRALAIANAIKAHIDYTIADGEAMGLEGAEIIPPDLNDARPALKLKKTGDTVEIGWGKQSLPVDGVEIWVKRGAGAFAFLATDTTTPKYVDTFPFPAVEETWTYKAVYVIDGARIGLWSEEVSINVKAG